MLVFTLSFFCYLIWTNNNLSNRILALEDQQIHNKPFQITKFEKDSLVLELNKYQQKEGYFTEILSSQRDNYNHTTTWAITMLTIILGLVGLIGVGWFWSRYEEMKQRLIDLELRIATDLTKSKEKISLEIKNLNKRFSILEVKSYQALGNTCSIAAEIYEKEKDYLSAYCFFISAAYVNNKFKKNATVVPTNLKSAKFCLDKLNNDDSLDVADDDIKKQLGDLAKSENEEIGILAKTIIQKHNEIFKLVKNIM